MATQNKTLTTAWQLLEAAPTTITLEQGHRLEYHSAASTPAAGAAFQSLIRDTDRTWRTFNGSNNIYARKSAGTVDPVVVGYGE